MAKIILYSPSSAHDDIILIIFTRTTTGAEEAYLLQIMTGGWAEEEVGDWSDNDYNEDDGWLPVVGWCWWRCLAVVVAVVGWISI